ncbi:MAG: hypothetical protein RLZZ436_1600 [Planctomycetota bacterium]|jgi:hypothetical protein
MKRNILQMVLATLMAVCTGTAVNAEDWAPGEGMEATMAVNIALGKTIEGKSDYGFCDTCYLAAYIQPGNFSGITTDLQGGRTYLFGGAVGEGNDLDIIIVDSSGDEVARDTKTDNVPIVEFTPSFTAKYTIRLKLYSAGGGRFCSMVLMQKGGWTLPMENLSRAGDVMLNRCRNVARQVPACFLEETGEWAVIGRVLNEREAAVFTDMRFGGGRRVVVAGGDVKTRDLDLGLFENGDGGAALDTDTLPDDEPILDARTSSGQRYRLMIENAKSDGPTVVMTAILDVD